MKVVVAFHSVYGHIKTMADAVASGVNDVSGVDFVLRKVPEFSGTVQHMEQGKEYTYQVYQGLQEIPECTMDDLRDADGVLFGSPARYGNMTAQNQALIDGTAQLWLSGAMEGKLAGVFTSTASTRGGQETTLLIMMVPLLHLGIVIVGVPYSTPGMIHTDARGGTPTERPHSQVRRVIYNRRRKISRSRRPRASDSRR